jgi:hypothetical protein
MYGSIIDARTPALAAKWHTCVGLSLSNTSPGKLAIGNYGLIHDKMIRCNKV